MMQGTNLRKRKRTSVSCATSSNLINVIFSSEQTFYFLALVPDTIPASSPVADMTMRWTLMDVFYPSWHMREFFAEVPGLLYERQACNISLLRLLLDQAVVRVRRDNIQLRQEGAGFVVRRYSATNRAEQASIP